MFTKAAKNLTDGLVRSHVIPESDFEVYCFGFEVGLAMAVNLLLSFIIGLLIGMPLESLLLLAVFIPLRSCAGGFHASSHFRCLWLSVLTVLAVLVSARLAANLFTPALTLLLGGASATLIGMLAPVQDANRPLDKAEVHLFKRRTKIALCANLLVLILLLVFGFETSAMVSALTLLVVCLSLCAGAAKGLFLRIRRSR